MAFLHSLFRLLSLALLSLHILAAPLIEFDGISSVPINKRDTSAYTPFTSTCPSTPLVRPATGISTGEANYIASRKHVTDVALAKWLQSVNPEFCTLKVPGVGLASSGGGVKALLEGAGVIKAFDSRDSNVGTSGLYQGLAYHGGLSGGSWLVSSLAGNNWPTVSSLQTSLWEAAFKRTVISPGTNATANNALIIKDIASKHDAGFAVTLTDPWGRLLSYQLLDGTDGGVANRMSGLTGLSSFTSHSVPYPILTALEVAPDQCIAGAGTPQMEMHPYEWGSWDSGIAAFTPTAYLGTSVVDGNPAVSGKCVQNYDNLGFLLGTSSDLFSDLCIPNPSVNSSNIEIAFLEKYLKGISTAVLSDEFSIFPNPFYRFKGSPLVSNQTELFLVDGGVAGQENPIWPFIQPARADAISVLIVNDNSGDTVDNFPNGTEIHTTYVQAQLQGLTRMPAIPPVSTFLSDGLNKHATFFGCHDPHVLTIVYLPNVAYNFPSNQSAYRLQYSVNETAGMIENGVLIGTQNGDANWPTCLGCAIVKKTGDPLPSACNACFEKYCYN